MIKPYKYKIKEIGMIKANVKPISIVSCFGKLFTTILCYWFTDLSGEIALSGFHKGFKNLKLQIIPRKIRINII